MAKGKGHSFTRPDGQIRQSQMVTTYGPGSMVDLVERAVVIGGLEHWSYGVDGFVALDDPRLRRSINQRLKDFDANLELAKQGYFRKAPECDGHDPAPLVGVRALEFPRWFVCQGCRRLARARDAFEEKKGRYRHACASPAGQAVPARFVAACRAGHLADFPWIPFAHSGRECGRPELYLLEEATGDLGRIRVECRNCNSSRAMRDASALPFGCHGDRPWLGGQAVQEPCDNQLEMLVRTASNAYFAQVVSALKLKEPDPSPLTLKLRQKDVWSAVHKVTKVEELQMLGGLINVVASAIEGEKLSDVIAAIDKERGGNEADTEPPLRSAEYQRFLSAKDELPGDLPKQGVEFAAYRVPSDRADLPPGIGRLVLVPELREVRVQVSFSRFDSVSANLEGEYELDAYAVAPAPLTLPTGNEKWLPAAEVRGEGFFLELDPDLLAAWEKRPAVVERTASLKRAFELDGRGGQFLGTRFYLLHSLAHLLLTAISLDCGYAASAIRERIYCRPAIAGSHGMAGILLSTGTTGSEGTLGGLVEEARRLRHHLRQAWDLGRLCSNDPVCAAHDPTAGTDDRRLEGAACHGCLYIAECSCERFNRYLDRALVLPTIGNDPQLAYFADRP